MFHLALSSASAWCKEALQKIAVLLYIYHQYRNTIEFCLIIAYNSIRYLSKYLILLLEEAIILPLLNMPFKALSDPSRRKIIQMLKERDMTAGEIADHFEMSKPSISHHLSILKQAELVIDERKGQNIYYSLNTTVFQEVVNWFFNMTDRSGGFVNEKD